VVRQRERAPPAPVVPQPVQVQRALVVQQLAPGQLVPVVQRRARVQRMDLALLTARRAQDPVRKDRLRALPVQVLRRDRVARVVLDQVRAAARALRQAARPVRVAVHRAQRDLALTAPVVVVREAARCPRSREHPIRVHRRKAVEKAAGRQNGIAAATVLLHQDRVALHPAGRIVYSVMSSEPTPFLFQAGLASQLCMVIKKGQLIELTFFLSGRRDSNPRPLAPHASTLPDCATSRIGLQM
jgi:hypothetical protein